MSDKSIIGAFTLEEVISQKIFRAFDASVVHFLNELSINILSNPNIKKHFKQVHNQGGLVILTKKNVKLKNNNVNLLLYCSNGSLCFNQINNQNSQTII